MLQVILWQSLAFPVFGGFEDNNVIYTVYIEKVYRSTFSEESTTINVISRANDKDKWWVSPYEIGQRYIITGLVQPYKKTPIMVDSMSLSAHVAVDGSLTPQSYSSKHTLGDIQTINELENNADVRKLFAYKYDLLDTIADDYEQTRLDGVSPENGTTLVAGDKQILVKSDDEVVKYIKDAIIIDTPSNVATAPITK